MTVTKRILSNTSGTYPSTRKSFMAAFDKLPRKVRDALNSADFPFAPQRLRTMLRRGASVAEIVQAIKRCRPDRDREDAARLAPCAGQQRVGGRSERSMRARIVD